MQVKGTIQVYTPNVHCVQFENEDELENGLKSMYVSILDYHLRRHLFEKYKNRSSTEYPIDIYPEIDHDTIHDNTHIKKEYNYVVHLPPALNVYDKKKYTENELKYNQYINNIRRLLPDEIKRVLGNYLEGTEYDYKLNNDFERRKEYVSSSNVLTIFTDEEVLKLCNRLSSPFIRRLCLNTKDNIKYLHLAAMKCYKKYGGYIITFLMRLPKLNFANNDVSNAKLSIDEFDGSLFTFHVNIGKDGPKYSFLFHSNVKNSKSEVITIRNNTRGLIEGHLTLDGYYNYRIASDPTNPLLFIDKMSKNNAVIYAGIHSGNCLNCGRPLQDPTSLRIGYGPSCAENLGIRY